jgi:hypothetical protein
MSSSTAASSEWRLSISLARSSVPPAPGTRLFACVIGGPDELLGWLESQLGLAANAEAWRRVIVVQDAIEAAVAAAAAAGTALPIARSFEGHPYAVARQLVESRDAFLMAVPVVKANASLPDIDAGITAPGLPLAIEQYAIAMKAAPPVAGMPAAALVATGIPDRLAAVQQCLLDQQTLPACTIELAEPAAEWPERWQSLLAEIKSRCKNVAIVSPVPEPTANGAAGSSLEILQAAIGESGPAGGKGGAQLPSATADRSLQALRCQSVAHAVQAAAAMIHDLADGRSRMTPAERAAGHHAHESLHDVVVVCEDDATAALLDGELHARGLPTTGASPASQASELCAILPLALEATGWPADPRRLLELLALPFSPIPRPARNPLANALRKLPAIGSPEWTEALKKADAAILQSAANNPQDKNRAARWRAALAFYLPCRATPPSKPGFLVDDLIKVADTLGGWATTRSRLLRNAVRDSRKAPHRTPAEAARLARLDRQSSQFMLLWKRCCSLRELAARLGAGTVIDHRQLSQLLDAVDGDVTRPMLHPESAGGPRRARSFAELGDFAGPATRVIWLGTDSRPLPRPAWSRSDIGSASHAFGINLDLARGQAAAIRRAERRGLRHVSDALLVFSYPPNDSASRPHPLWTVIGEVLRPKKAVPAVHDYRPPVLTTELEAPPGNIWRVRTMTTPIESAPKATATWTLPAAVAIPARSTVSWTDVEKRLGCPFAWSMNYACGIKASELAKMPNDSLWSGNVGEKILQIVFPGGNPPHDEADALRRLDAALRNDLPKLHAGLALSFGAVARQRFEAEMQKAVVGLQRLVDRQVTLSFQHDIAELKDAAGQGLSWANAALSGIIDAIGIAKAGKATFAIVLDEKYANPAGREKLLQQARPWQLLFYADALTRAHKPNAITDAAGKMSPVDAIGFLIIAEGRILVPEWHAGPLAHPPFDDAVTIVPLATGFPTPTIASRMTTLETEVINATAAITAPGAKIEAHPQIASTGGSLHPHLELIHGDSATDAADEACKYCSYGLLCGRREVT